MKNITKTILMSLILFLSISANAQKTPYYNTQEQAIEAAYIAFDNEMNSGELKEWATSKGIKGSYTFDITIGGKKGEVYTVSTIERSEDGEIGHQNSLKNYVKLMRMPFKLPKDRSYKFRYEFKF
ncbi:MAG: hypothetical protein DWP98_03465 [Bacteroidetes bacterium]|nr:MAG: hypothetical protein DWP98_03465 [Bacteroidota bacterium]MBL1143680.1 hypothetical protein [Bacteroidota bacterium]MCB0801842.1 hypothetical protein [Flavobacteriales bacterium]NOG56482.1 hypothetical protein [Bacteroidota bacterium]